VTLKYYSHLDLAYTKGLAVQLLKSVQNEHRNLYDRWSEDCCWEDFFLSANTYDRTTQYEESYRREHAEHEGLYRSSLHLCDELRQLTSATSVDTAISTSAVATSPFLKNQSIVWTVSPKSSSLQQWVWISTQNDVFLIHSDLKKRVKFRPWLQQIVAKLNVNMSDNNVSVQFWYLHSWLEEVGFKSGHLNLACIKSNKVLNHTIIRSWSISFSMWFRIKRATCTLKALKQKEKPFTRHLTTFEQTLLKAKA
jgi:hypothetical protein